MIPLGIMCLAIGTALAVALSALVTGIFTLPLLLLHIYMFMRICYWWCKPRVKENKKNTMQIGDLA